MVTIDEIIRYRNRQDGRNRPRFNIIGFTNYSDWRPSKKCPIHTGNVLIPRRNIETGEDMPGLMCPVCGTPYSENEAPTEEGIKGKFSGKQETRIITARSTKKYYDKQGNLINDPDLIQEIQRGANVISYHEEKHGEDTFYHKETRRLIRARKK